MGERERGVRKSKDYEWQRSRKERIMSEMGSRKVRIVSETGEVSIVSERVQAT